MEARGRYWRRLLGLLARRLPEMGLGRVPDPRGRNGRRWPLATLLSSMLIGLAAGCRSLREVEHLTANLSRGVRGLLHIGRRVADTTLREVLVRIEPDSIREVLRRLVRQAHRRKALRPDGLPCGVLSMDGKATPTPIIDDKYAQRQGNGAQIHGMLRTTTSTLISAPGRPCIDAMPIPASTNEVGSFAAAFDAVRTAYPEDLFEIVMGDAGLTSLANATHVHDADRGYIFQIKPDSQKTLYAEAYRTLGRLGPEDALATHEERINGRHETRTLWLSTELEAFGDWTHLRVVLRLERRTVDSIGDVTHGIRYFVSNVHKGRFDKDQWLAVLRRRWAVENECHHTFDTAFAEDDSLFVHDPHGMLVVVLLRRVVYTMLALFRSVTQRADERRAVPWRDLLWDISHALAAAAEEVLRDLRLRPDPGS